MANPERITKETLHIGKYIAAVASVYAAVQGFFAAAFVGGILSFGAHYGEKKLETKATQHKI